MNERGAYLVTWFRCECGKIHTATFLSPSSVCKCGRNLYVQCWRCFR